MGEALAARVDPLRSQPLAQRRPLQRAVERREHFAGARVGIVVEPELPPPRGGDAQRADHGEHPRHVLGGQQVQRPPPRPRPDQPGADVRGCQPLGPYADREHARRGVLRLHAAQRPRHVDRAAVKARSEPLRAEAFP